MPSTIPIATWSSWFLPVTPGTRFVTLGGAIANTQPDAPYIYVLIFLVAVPGQISFGVARMTLPAVVTMYALSLGYFKATGTYLFYDAHIPLPVFLGMHLLFTDPSTSPRSELGRIGFGVLYALAATGCYMLLGQLGAPTFYDKLLCVPLLNLAVQRIDRLVPRVDRHAVFRRLGLDGPLGRANLAHMTAWVLFFGAMTAAGATDGMHRGDSLPFWEQACAEGRANACQRLIRIERAYYRTSDHFCNSPTKPIRELIKDLRL